MGDETAASKALAESYSEVGSRKTGDMLQRLHLLSLWHRYETEPVLQLITVSCFKFRRVDRLLVIPKLPKALIPQAGHH